MERSRLLLPTRASPVQLCLNKLVINTANMRTVPYRTVPLRFQEYILRVIWPRKTPRDRAKVVLGIRPYFDAGWFNYPKYMAQDLLVVVVGGGDSE